MRSCVVYGACSTRLLVLLRYTQTTHSMPASMLLLSRHFPDTPRACFNAAPHVMNTVSPVPRRTAAEPHIRSLFIPQLNTTVRSHPCIVTLHARWPSLFPSLLAFYFILQLSCRRKSGQLGREVVAKSDFPFFSRMLEELHDPCKKDQIQFTAE